MPRLIRRKPLFERITSMLNPMDFLLWLSEEIETREWDSQLVGTQLGAGMNFIFLLARANSGSGSASEGDIFGDDVSPGWLSYLVNPIVWSFVILSCTNAVYALTRTRKYRLFEASIDMQPTTPSLRRVKIQSSPGSASPLRYFMDLITPGSAESRAHPDKVQDVWELAVWDPLPMTLRLFCLFSPGHVLVYLLSLPLAPLDPQPSATIFNAIVMQIILSGQMLFLSSRFAQQAKDNAIVQKEVMNEYNTKFVQPRLHPTVRDVGTQFSEDQGGKARGLIQIGTPTTYVRHAFISRPHYNADSDDTASNHSGSLARTQTLTPTGPRRTETFAQSIKQHGSALRPSLGAKAMPSAPLSANDMVTTGTNTAGTGFGGHMGIYNHNRSPLKKTIGLNDLNSQEAPSPRNSREMAAYEQRHVPRASSPSKLSDMRRTPSTRTASTTSTLSSSMRNRTQPERYPRW